MDYSILIIKTGALGDVLRTTTLLPELRKRYKEIHISWLTSEKAKSLLLNNHLIDNIYTIENHEEMPQNFDLVLSLDDDKKCAALASSLKCQKLIGAYDKKGQLSYTEDSSAWFGMGLLRPAGKGGLAEANRLKKANKKNFHELMAAIADVSYSDEQPILNLTGQEIAFGKDFAKKHNISGSDTVIGLNTGAGSRWQLKRWPVEHTAQLADLLVEKLDAKVILLGGKEEQKRNEEIKQLAKNDLIDAGTGNTIREFASIINLCKALVTSDTLAMYLAISLKKQLVVLVGPTSSAEIELYGRGEKLQADMPCICCYKKHCDIVPNCMDLISVDTVYKAVLRVLNSK